MLTRKDSTTLRTLLSLEERGGGFIFQNQLKYFIKAQLLTLHQMCLMRLRYVFCCTIMFQVCQNICCDVKYVKKAQSFW